VVQGSSTKYVWGSTTRATSLWSSVWLWGAGRVVDSESPLPRRRLLGWSPHRVYMDRGHGYGVYGDIGDAVTHRSLGTESYYVLRDTFYLFHSWHLTSIDRPRSFPKSRLSVVGFCVELRSTICALRSPHVPRCSPRFHPNDLEGPNGRGRPCDG
jgi:hypothetical protein